MTIPQQGCLRAIL
jgi:hypothetical protein